MTKSSTDTIPTPAEVLDSEYNPAKYAHRINDPLFRDAHPEIVQFDELYHHYLDTEIHKNIYNDASLGQLENWHVAPGCGFYFTGTLAFATRAQVTKAVNLANHYVAPASKSADYIVVGALRRRDTVSNSITTAIKDGLNENRLVALLSERVFWTILNQTTGLNEVVPRAKPVHHRLARSRYY